MANHIRLIASNEAVIFDRDDISSPANEPLPIGRGGVDNGNMEYVPRPELDAKLEAIEARMDGRLARIEDAVKRISDDNAATRAGISNLKTTTIVVAVSSVIAILFGVAAFNATLLNNMIASHGSGKEVGAALEQARSQAVNTQHMLEQIKQEQQQTTQSTTPVTK